MKTIAVYTTKGGVGKSTLTLTLASELSYTHNLSTRVLDYDPSQLSCLKIRSKEVEWINQPDFGKFKENRLPNYILNKLKLGPHYPITKIPAKRLPQWVQAFKVKAEENHEDMYLLIDGSSGFGEGNAEPLLDFFSELDYLFIPIELSPIVLEGTMTFLKWLFENPDQLPKLKHIYLFWNRFRVEKSANYQSAQPKVLSYRDKFFPDFPIPVSFMNCNIKSTVTVDIGKTVTSLGSLLQYDQAGLADWTREIYKIIHT
ncbi:ParA family protein [Siphonobacter sp. SORGH_AS_1065]|uniref:ParA family protein n=1 Tax=Siphonobacter sp. SORGH_AS_1065 TaxID=3041795 RepID=UPI00278A9569|nr:ParA family protein [Siphonobacter sp. SORGH_AS_1065]MDQ1090457.1 chromosome partitioning protein [Siphonobacter sp. SORGH_AS_1065]